MNSIYRNALNNLQELKGNELNISEGVTLRAIRDDIFYKVKRDFPFAFKRILDGRTSNIVNKIMGDFFQKVLHIGFHVLPEIDENERDMQFDTINGPLTVDQLRGLWKKYERDKDLF